MKKYRLLSPFIFILALISCGEKSDVSTSPTTALPFEQDSIRISSLFSAALTSPNAATYIDSAKVVVTEAQDSVRSQDLYLAQLATFQLKRGEFDNAMKTAEEGLKFNADSLSVQRAKFYNIQGHVFSFTKNNPAAIASFKKSLALFEKANDSLNIAYINNNIANIFFSLTDYSTAYKHSKASFDIIQNYPQNPYYSSILSILAISEAFVDKIESAKTHASLALSLTENTPNVVPYALSLYALGDIAVSQDSLIRAKEYYEKSLGICETYKLLPYVLINKTALLNVSVRTEDYKSGVTYGTEALALSEQTQNENIQLSIHKNLSRAYAGINDANKAFYHMDTAYQLKEEISSKENKSIIHDLLIQYESEKKDKEISENRIKILEDEATINRSRFYITLLVIAILVAGVIVIFYLKNRKEQLLRMEKEKETELIKANLNGEQRERLRLSRELHDGIASELLGLKLKAEENNVDASWRENLASIHQEVRRISHNLSPFKIEQFGLIEALKIFCIENSSSKSNIHFYSMGDVQIAPAYAQVIYRCAQELIQNALKHGDAKDIDVQIFLDKEIRLSIEDDGKGMNELALKEVINKIKAQWGPSGVVKEVNGDSSIGSGTSFSLSFFN
jgi:signal transduction histidine kinase